MQVTGENEFLQKRTEVTLNLGHPATALLSTF
jgi:hypothetical protein